MRSALQQHKLYVYAGVPANQHAPSKPLDQVDFTRGCALIVGNEARGVSPQLRGAAIDISIPTAGVESLNVAVAAGILLYEARRQRSLHA